MYRLDIAKQVLKENFSICLSKKYIFDYIYVILMFYADFAQA